MPFDRERRVDARKGFILARFSWTPCGHGSISNEYIIPPTRRLDTMSSNHLISCVQSSLWSDSSQATRIDQAHSGHPRPGGRTVVTDVDENSPALGPVHWQFSRAAPAHALTNTPPPGRRSVPLTPHL